MLYVNVVVNEADSPVGHEPAGDGDGDCDERKERRDDERDDEADLGDADLLVARVPRAHVRPRTHLPLDRQDGVRLNLQRKFQLWLYSGKAVVEV